VLGDLEAADLVAMDLIRAVGEIMCTISRIKQN
jgi:hypothetical protein